jgi:hypothetical protein
MQQHGFIPTIPVLHAIMPYHVSKPILFVALSFFLIRSGWTNDRRTQLFDGDSVSLSILHPQLEPIVSKLLSGMA